MDKIPKHFRRRTKKSEKKFLTSGKAISNSKALHKMYYSGYAFPEWSIDWLSEEYKNKLSNNSILFYDKKDKLDEVKKVVTQREPCNIEMKKYFDTVLFNEKFGWISSYYTRFYEDKGYLAPNIGIYCKTPISPEYGKGKKTNFSEYKSIHVYNAIGLAFDNEQQPDYRYFIKDNHEDEITSTYMSIFTKIFNCAISQRLSVVALSLFGTGSFAKLYSKMKDLNYVFIPCLLSAINSTEYQGQIKFMGFENEKLEEYLKDEISYSSIGLFPACINNVDVNTTLFVNAWDPHSFAGNGNGNDNSLDGFIGRYTAIALLCSPLTNLSIEYYVSD